MSRSEIGRHTPPVARPRSVWALDVACGHAKISVGVHVHRVTIRWRFVATATPEQTALALETTPPRPRWIEVNARLVPFGKHV